MNPQEAIEAPRFASDSAPDSFYPHTYYPGQAVARVRLPGGDDRCHCRSMGHDIARAGVCGMGATVARRNPDTGVLSTGADPRRACYALSW